MNHITKDIYESYLLLLKKYICGKIIRKKIKTQETNQQKKNLAKYEDLNVKNLIFSLKTKILLLVFLLEKSTIRNVDPSDVQYYSHKWAICVDTNKI